MNYPKLKYNKLLLINGPRGCGKDTLLAHLESLRLPFKISRAETKTFAAEVVRDWFGVTEAEWKNIYTTQRKLKPSRLLHTGKTSIQRALVLPQVKEKFDLLLQQFSHLRDGNYLSPVLALMIISEAFHKPVGGQDYFGYQRAKSLPPIMSLPTTLYVDASCGFPAELSSRCLRVLEENGYAAPRNILLLQIRDRGPQDFLGDSRGWVDLHDSMEVIHNSGSLEDFLVEATNIILDWVAL